MLGISGEYYFLTSESSVNTELPDYLQVFSSMHEYMHFLGVMREDEANFYAYVALTKSDNAYYNYCAYVYAYELVLASLSRTYREEFEKLYAELPLYVQNSFEEHRKFNLKHESSLIGKLSKYLNTKAISLRDSRGTSSYSRSVCLIVDYICSFGT